ncbi:MAG: hypothetical protein ABSC37_06530 [Xanthobacteraceae bacterium]
MIATYVGHVGTFRRSVTIGQAFTQHFGFDQHRCGDEAAWWKKADVDPLVSARARWLQTHSPSAISDKMGIEDQSPATPDQPIGAGLPPQGRAAPHR